MITRHVWARVKLYVSVWTMITVGQDKVVHMCLYGPCNKTCLGQGKVVCVCMDHDNKPYFGQDKVVHDIVSHDNKTCLGQGKVVCVCMDHDNKPYFGQDKVVHDIVSVWTMITRHVWARVKLYVSVWTMITSHILARIKLYMTLCLYGP